MTGIYKPRIEYLTTPYEKKATETVEEIKEYPFLSNPLRGIRDEIYKALGYKMKVSEKDGKTLQAAYYPILEKGKLVGWKKRDFTKPKKDCFSVVGKCDATCDLVGAWKLRPGKRITIVEGEEDLAAAYQVMYDQIQSNAQWRGKLHPNVVSVTGGAPYAAENISHNLETINEYSQIVTCFDNDKATRDEYSRRVRKGYEATCETHLLLGFDRCKYVPLKLKDPSEYVQSGKSSILAEALAFGVRDFTPITIEEGADIPLEELLVPNAKGAILSSFPKTFEILGGVRFYEGTLILAPPKSGKTTSAKAIGYDLMMHCLALLDQGQEEKVGHIFLEETSKKTRQSYLALDTGVSLPKLREKGVDIKEGYARSAQDSYNRLFASGINIFLNTKEGSLKPEDVVKHFKYMYAKGCRYIILDHLSMVISGSNQGNERKEIDNLLTEIAAFCESHPVHVFVIAHIKRTDYQPKRDKETDEVLYPYWLPVHHTDARGSGAFEQLMWNCICLEPEIIDEAENIGRVRTKVTFCREWGTKGIGDYMKWSEEEGKLVPAWRD